jgi:DNA recombination protein RmuC
MMPAVSSDVIVQWGTFALAAFAAGLLGGWLLARVRAAAAHAAGRASRDAEIVQLRAEREAAEQARLQLRQQHDAAARELESGRAKFNALNLQVGELGGRLERLQQAERELAEQRAEVQRLIDARQKAEQQATQALTSLREQQQAALEREALLADKFKLVSGQLLEQQSQKLTTQNQSNLDVLLAPLREQLGEFRKRVDEVYDKESRERGLLKAEIEGLKGLNRQLSDDAANLTRALKGESRTQGAWGELVLERLLEASGLQRGLHYETQVVLRDDDGGKPRPDVIVHLPEKRDLIIDAKVSLTAYERYCTASGEDERAEQLTAHLNSLRTHVKQLAERRYSDLPGVNSLEFVLMFVPVEAAYIEAVHHDDALHAFALDKQVIIVTTSTLLATLRTVMSLWRFDDRNRNALEIADRAGKLYDKFAGFIDDLQEVQSKFDAARLALSAASSKLSSGRGNLLGQVEKLRELGARASKALPPELVESAQLDEVQARIEAPPSGVRPLRVK